MPPNEPALEALPPVHFAALQDAARVNAALSRAFDREKHGDAVRHTHHFHGRFENTYIARERLPEIVPIVEFALSAARRLLRYRSLHFGFWFNEMQPGQRTSLHAHEELDELLSAVYYVNAPAGGGRLLLHDEPAQIRITPAAGMLVLFPPDLPHEVEVNASAAARLSIAFNFGPSHAVS